MANSNQLWTCVGITVHNGDAKVRFGVDRVRRIKQFTKGGATRIDLVDLPSEMNKLDALNFLKAHAEFQAPEDQAVISEAYDYRAKVASKAVGEVKVRATRAKKEKPSLDSIKARAKKATAKVEVSAEAVVQAAAEGSTGTAEPALV
jgi:CCR4-NOT transcriptional regulation complex NOT5 subunit